jgi:catechol 2,3-dioxygenase-like lactoylglutathione lyase family enzyme
MIGAAKVIVRDLPRTQAFYEQAFGLKEVMRREIPGGPVEVTLGFERGARLVLVAPPPNLEAALRKSQFPLVFMRTPEFDALTQRIQAAGAPLQRLPANGASRSAIARDPSGNGIEIMSAAAGSPPAVGGSKLSVSDREQAERFYTRVFGVRVIARFDFTGFDEAIIGFGAGPFLSIFEATQDAGLPRSQFAVTSFFTEEFAAVEQRLRAEGLPVQRIDTGASGVQMLRARDPSGNVFEILSL